MSCSSAAANGSSASRMPSSLPNERANNARRKESCHNVLRSNGPHFGFGIRLKTGAPQRKVLDRADADHGNRQLDAGDLAAEAKIGRVDELQHLSGQAGIRLDGNGELDGTILRVLRQLEQTNGALRQCRKLRSLQDLIEVVLEISRYVGHLVYLTQKQRLIWDCGIRPSEVTAARLEPATMFGTGKLGHAAHLGKLRVVAPSKNRARRRFSQGIPLKPQT